MKHAREDLSVIHPAIVGSPKSDAERLGDAELASVVGGSEEPGYLTSDEYRQRILDALREMPRKGQHGYSEGMTIWF